MESGIIIAIIGAVATIIVSLIAVYKEVKVQQGTLKLIQSEEQCAKLQEEIRQLQSEIRVLESSKLNQLRGNILDRLGELGIFNELKNSVERIFKYTKADRFFILFSLNGTHEMRTVAVAFELQKNLSPTRAIIRYRDVEIDDEYRALLKQVERDGIVTLSRETMNPQILKDFYTLEGINSVKLIFIERRHLDEVRDVVIFGTVGAYDSGSWTDIDSAAINTEFQSSIKPIIRSFF